MTHLTTKAVREHRPCWYNFLIHLTATHAPEVQQRLGTLNSTSKANAFRGRLEPQRRKSDADKLRFVPVKTILKSAVVLPFTSACTIVFPLLSNQLTPLAKVLTLCAK